MSFIAGPYTMTYNAIAVAITEDGFDLDQVFFSETVRGDNQGSSDQDDVYRGGNTTISFVGEEWNVLNGNAIFRPWAAFGTMGQVGRLATDNARALVMTVVAGTPAANGGAGLTSVSASKSILAPDFNVKHFFSTRLRKLPIRLKLYPFQSASDTIWFSTT